MTQLITQLLPTSRCGEEPAQTVVWKRRKRIFNRNLIIDGEKTTFARVTADYAACRLYTLKPSSTDTPKSEPVWPVLCLGIRLVQVESSTEKLYQFVGWVCMCSESDESNPATWDRHVRAFSFDALQEFADMIREVL